MQCVYNVVDIFPKYSQQTPHSSPWWASYGVSFVSSVWSMFRLSGEYKWGAFCDMVNIFQYTHNRHPIAHPVSYGMSFVSFKPGVCSTSVIVMLHSILCNMIFYLIMSVSGCIYNFVPKNLKHLSSYDLVLWIHCTLFVKPIWGYIVPYL